MLKLYDHLEAMLQVRQNRNKFYERRLTYFVSDIIELLAIENTDEIDLAFSRAIQACEALHIPFDYHFKKLYRSNGKNVMVDYKISALARYLIIVNCNPTNESVAKAQLYFAINQFTKK